MTDFIGRREFITLLGGGGGGVAVGGIGAAAVAKKSSNITRRTDAAVSTQIDAFREGLRDLGWVEGQNSSIEHRDAGGAIRPRDGDCIRVPLVLMDATAIAEVQAGKAQLSVGYTANFKPGEGKTPSGEVYDGMLTNIRANHVALVSRARGGSHLRIGDSTRDDNKYVVTDEMQRRVDEAYADYCQQLNNAWRGKDNPPLAAVPNDTPERAYSEMRAAMQNAWKRGAR